jgi:hypothetical protein
MQLWFRLMRFTLLNKFPKSDHKTHKILIIGDGLAEGFGSSINMMKDSGISTTFKKKLYADNRINQSWFVINKGYYKSLSEDWLPDSKNKPSHLSHLFKKNLWETYLENPSLKDAEIVLVMLGNQDQYSEKKETRGNPLITVNNLKIILTNLLDQGKIVSSSYLLTPKNSKNHVIDFKNKLLKKLFLELKEKFPDQFFEGPQLYNLVYQKFERLSDGLHLKDEAYSYIANIWFDIMINQIVKIQWKFWKEYLQN